MSKNFTRWISSLLALLLLSTILPLSTSADIQPWKGNPWEGNPWDGTPWDRNLSEIESESPETDKGNIEDLDPVLLEELGNRGWEEEDIENLQYTDPDLWEFLTSSQEWENYFKRVGNGIGDTATGGWEWTKSSTKSMWDYVSSGDIFSDAKQSTIDKFHYVMDGGMWKDTKSTARYLFSKNAWNDVKSGLSSTWEYTKNIGSYLFSKQSVKDAYQYVTSGEILMDYMEDFESFATGVYPETQQKVSGMERIVAAGSIIFKPVKALDKIDKVGKAADKAKMLAKVGDKKRSGVDLAGKGIDKTRPSWRQSEIDVEKDFPEFNAQKSFKDGTEVPYGEKGSSRPDLYQTGHSIEVKNYKITTSRGRSRLVNNVSKQVEKRLNDLPNDTKQSVMIDIRGQNVSEETLDELYEKIMNKTNGNVDIRFKTN